jgi:ribosomal protein S18 acetylase RimI-like enzyme
LSAAKTPFFAVLSKKGIVYNVSWQDNGLFVEARISGGAAAWLKWQPGRVHLMLLETPPAMRNRGLGSRLLAALCAAARASQQPLDLCATPCSASSLAREDLIAWYERRGFARCDPSGAWMTYLGDDAAAA